MVNISFPLPSISNREAWPGPNPFPPCGFLKSFVAKVSGFVSAGRTILDLLDLIEHTRCSGLSLDIFEYLTSFSKYPVVQFLRYLLRYLYTYHSQTWKTLFCFTSTCFINWLDMTSIQNRIRIQTFGFCECLVEKLQLITRFVAHVFFLYRVNIL